MKRSLLLGLGLFILCAAVLPIFVLSRPIIDPPSGPYPGDEIYAYQYKSILGIKSGGSITDTYVIDNVHLRWTCFWSWTPWTFFTFSGQVRLYFPTYRATQLIIRFYAGRGWISDGITRIDVKYTDGTVKYFNDVDDGTHTFTLTSSKYVKYVDIQYWEQQSIFGGDRYIGVDKIAIIMA